MSKQKKIRRIGLIGLGSIGRRHLRVLKELRPDLEVFVVRSGLGPKCVEESLADGIVRSVEALGGLAIDAAIIASPASYHVDQALKLVELAIPLLVEKPLSHDLDKTRELQRLAESEQVCILIGYVLRHSEDLNYVHEMIVDGGFGAISEVTIVCSSFLPDWRPGQDYRESVSAKGDLGGGVLLELSHELDYANWLFGPFKSVEANITNSGKLQLEVEDTADLRLISHTGVRVSIHTDFVSRQSVRECVIAGKNGGLRWDGINRSVTSQRNAECEKVVKFDTNRDRMYRSQLSHFLGCVECGVQPRVGLGEGIEVLELIEAARRSDKESGVVFL